MKVKIRYIAAAVVIIISIAVTPLCIKSAHQFRGYAAYGGEYLVILIGLIAAHIILEWAKVWDGFIQLRRKH